MSPTVLDEFFTDPHEKKECSRFFACSYRSSTLLSECLVTNPVIFLFSKKKIVAEKPYVEIV